MARGAENIYSIFWLYNKTGESFLLDLADIVFKQTLDWVDIFTNFPIQGLSAFTMISKNFERFLIKFRIS